MSGYSVLVICDKQTMNNFRSYGVLFTLRWPYFAKNKLPFTFVISLECLIQTFTFQGNHHCECFKNLYHVLLTPTQNICKTTPKVVPKFYVPTLNIWIISLFGLFFIYAKKKKVNTLSTIFRKTDFAENFS